MVVAKGRDMDLQHLRAQEFPVTREWRFFNHAATSPLSVQAATAMEQHIRAQLAHGSLAAGGQKWLLGPRGCGVFYCSQRMLDQLKVTVVGASSVIDEENYLDYHLTLKPDATRFEYGTPNAIGIVGLRGAVELFLEVGPEPIARQILALTDRFCERVEAKGYTLFSSRRPGEKSGIVSFYKKGADSHQIAAQLQAQRFILSVRDGRLRISPHFYNTTDEIDTLLEALP
jgi:selenocysteine lyase/cysteine desulfurase